MPVINVFEQTAQLGRPTDNTSRVRPDNSGAMAIARENAGIARTFAVGVQNLQEQIATADVMAANNEYNRRVTELENKLMQNKESNAFENVAKLDEGRQKIMQDILQKGPQTLRYGAGNRAFVNSADRDYVAQRARMQRYQIGEAERYQDTQLNLQLENNMKNVAADYSDGVIMDNIYRGDVAVAARYYNYGPERIELEQNKYRAALAKTAVDSAFATGDNDSAERILNDYRGLFTPAEYNRYKSAVYEYKAQEYEYNLAGQLYEQYGDNFMAVEEALENGSYMAYTPDGKLDLEPPGDTWIAKAGVSLDGAQQKTRSGVAELAAWYKAQSGEPLLVTSGTDSTNLHAAGKRSHGGGWKVDVASDWLEVPENRRRFIQYAKSLGVATIDEYANPSANSTGGHLDLDFTDYNGGGGRRLNFAEKQKVLTNYRSIAKQREAAEKDRIDNLALSMNSTIYGWKQQGMTRGQAERQIRSIAGADVELGKELQKTVDFLYGADSKGLESWRIDLYNDMLADGRFRSGAEYLDYLAEEGASDKQIYEATKTFKQFKNGEGQFKFGWDGIKENVVGTIKDKQAKELAWQGAQAAGKWFIADYTTKNGHPPTDYEVINACREALKKNVSFSYDGGMVGKLYDDSYDFSRAELALAGIRDVATYYDPNTLHVIFDDGRRLAMTPEELDEFIKVRK